MLDERQQRVLGALSARSDKLAGFYRSALDGLDTVDEEGLQAVRVSIVCHCMRELMMGLPALMADKTIPRPKPSSGSQLRNLPELLGKNPELDLALDQDIIPIPRAVARAILALVTAQVQEVGRNRSNAANLITAGTDGKHPAVDQWMDAYEFFVSWVHLDQQDEMRILPTGKQIAANIRVVEDVVEVRTAAFFENLHAVQDLLAQINTISEGDRDG